LCRWGAVEEIVTNNGTAFVSTVEHLAQKHSIHHICISAYNSCANGLVERQHYPVREAIMKACVGDERKWREVIHAVFWAERVTIQHATGYSPFYIVHGVHPILPFNITEATYLVPALDTGMTTSDLIGIHTQLLFKWEEDLVGFRSDILKARLEALRWFEETFSHVIVDFNFNPGWLVLLHNSWIEESLNRKTKPHYLGPYVVIKWTTGGSYILAELDGSVSRLRAAAFHIIPYHSQVQSRILVTRLINIPLNDIEDLTVEDPIDSAFDHPNTLPINREDL
jgi:hypothetical protein